MADVSTNVLINTNYGYFVLALNETEAPLSTANFLAYVDANFYDGKIFHRVMADFVIQGGGIETDFDVAATAAPIALESTNGLSNLRGTVAMARTASANSATSQFYINLVDNQGLDYRDAANPGYAVFGEVIDGMEVVDAIAAAHTFSVYVGSTNYANLPFPFLVEILDAQRFVSAETLSPTEFSTGTDPSGVAATVFAGARAAYGIVRSGTDGQAVTLLDGAHTAVEATAQRLHFNDKKLAFDIDAAAGKTALLINAAFGYDYLQPELNGIGLSVFDAGYSVPEVAGMALQTGLWLDIVGESTDAAFVETVYTHVVGHAPDTATAAYFVGMLERGEMDQAAMLAMAAETQANASFIDLVALSHIGLEYL